MSGFVWFWVGDRATIDIASRGFVDVVIAGEFGFPRVFCDDKRLEIDEIYRSRCKRNPLE